MIKRRLLGEILVEEGVITKEQRDRALQEQKRLGVRLGEAIQKLGYASESVIAKAIARQLGIQYMDLKGIKVDSSVLEMIPESFARKHRILPVKAGGGKMLLAMADPLDVFAEDETAKLTKHVIEPIAAPESELMDILQRYYRGELEDAVKAVESEYQPGWAAAQAAEEEASRISEAATEDTPIVRFVNTVVTQAVKDRASDIHIEPESATLRVRFRIDGVLNEVMKPPKHLHAGVLSRLKILSGIDIAEKRIPQDGSFTINSEGRQFDIRTSTLPTLHGEKIVMRLLEKTAGLPSLRELGFSENMLAEFEKMIQKSYGFILSTGPTGCGKTTTMYSSLKNISTVEKNVITIEDPVEYNLKGINQVQINPKAGLSFASGLRSILRQDPDIIMVGEIRDLETASIATHAALTGHLVLSTLHTNDAVGAIARLVDMGVEPFLITSSLVGVMGQRLIRRVCPHCKESYKAPSAGFESIVGVSGEVTLYKGKGCPECRQTGYLGREGLFELLRITEGIKAHVISKSPASIMKAKAVSEGFQTLRQEGLRKALAGITTFEEVMRVTQEEA